MSIYKASGGAVATLTDTQTLSNKTFVAPVLGAASATSITFGGTALANYVEGTFTPTVTLVGGAGNTVPVYTTNSGNYTRIGNRCFAEVYLAGDGGAEGAGTGQINIALPIAANASALDPYFQAGVIHNNASDIHVLGYIAAAGTTIRLYYLSGASLTSLTGADQNNASRYITLKFQYQV